MSFKTITLFIFLTINNSLIPEIESVTFTWRAEKKIRQSFLDLFFNDFLKNELDIDEENLAKHLQYDLENGKIRRTHQQDWAMDVFNKDGKHLASRKFNGRFYSFNSVQILNNSIIVNNEKSNTDSSFTYHVFDVSGLE